MTNVNLSKPFHCIKSFFIALKINKSISNHLKLLISRNQLDSIVYSNL